MITIVKSNSGCFVLAAVAGFIAFIGDFLVTIVLGFLYPNYNHLALVMNELDTSQSPVAVLMKG
jgi:fucose permease